MKVIIASQNSAKVLAVRQGFAKAFPESCFVFEGVATISGVSAQPMNDAETFQGAWNRAENASQMVPDADFWLGLESGIAPFGQEMSAFSWVVAKSRDQHYGKGRTLTFFLPPQIIQLLRQGYDLGQADDMVFNRIHANRESGSIGLLTGDVITRTSYYADAVVTALIPFKNQSLYF